MRILLFCPTYKLFDGTLALRAETAASIDALDHGGHEVTTWISVDEEADKRGNVVKQYQKARERTIKDGFDAVLFIEHDMIIPPDALVKLADVPQADVVYGVYLWRHGSPMVNILRYVDSVNTDQSLDFFPTELAKAWKQKIIRCSGLGFGCTFIRRSVFDKVKIRKPPDGDYPDGPLASDCQRLGLKQYARFDVECGHIREDGFILWPHVTLRGPVVDVRIARPFNGSVNGDVIHFQEGLKYTVPIEPAVQWSKAGYLEILGAGVQP